MIQVNAKIKFQAKGKVRDGVVEEISLWRRTNETAYRLRDEATGEMFWFSEVELEKVRIRKPNKEVTA